MKREISLKTDIAVIGGGPAGLSAAITAARMGKRVLLLEKNGYLGGNAQLKICYGVKHTAWDMAYDGDELADWLLSHKKNKKGLSH